MDLLLPQIVRLEAPIACETTVGARLHVPRREITYISTWLAVLKGHQHGHREGGHAILQHQVHGHARDLAADKMANYVHHSRCAKHDKQIFKFQIHERHSRLQVSVHWCHLQRHITTPLSTGLPPCRFESKTHPNAAIPIRRSCTLPQPVCVPKLRPPSCAQAVRRSASPPARLATLHRAEA